MWATLRKHPGIAAKLVALFHARFDPRWRAGDRAAVRKRRSPPRSKRRSTKVQSLDEDRIMRHFVNAIRSAIRTNFYQIDEDGQPKPQIAIKYRRAAS